MIRAYYVNEDDVLGVICQEILEEPVKVDNEEPMEDFKLEDLPPISPDDLLVGHLPAIMA
ncbi:MULTISPECIES: hypothetical protein [Shewanella]|uniref:hypothetical protein n=1 Tax=unclassified Shewanella TaxID=196818 RepID=UPI0010C0FD80|nr:hypothetical protein [Shewanella sp. MEBiC00475]